MKNNSRRRFLLNTSLATGGLLIAGRIGASKKYHQPNALACVPDSTYQLTGTINSTKSGNWSDAATWGGKTPAATDTPVISASHTINFDLASTTVAGININSGGTLSFDTSKSTTLLSTRNVLLQGKLQMRPGSSSVIQTLRFTGINENSFVGGGMDPLDSDVGLWVIGNGVLDIQGTSKKAWTNVTNSLSAGLSVISVADASGWNINDEIIIAPSEKPDPTGNYTKGEERTIKAISGNTVTLNSSLSKDHPSATFNGKTKYAEVMNLTRNVMVEGTSTGNSHIFIHAATKHSISNMQMRFMGPRKDTGGGAEKEFVPGRYGLHFHHAGDASRGTTVTGCVVRDTGSHAFVPHASHGITFEDCVSYKTKEAAFWADEGDISHSITYNNCIAGDIGFVPRSMTFEDPTSPSFGTHGFLLGIGDDCACTNCVVWGQVASEDFGAFTWQANNEGVWKFENNLAHNCVQGIWVWQNTSKNHIIDKFIAYNCQNGFLHGAYANSYTFNQCDFFNCNIRFQANSSDAGLHLKDSYVDVGGLHDYAIDSRFGRVDSSYPIQIIGCTLKGYKLAPLYDTNGADEGAWIKKMYDMVNCTFAGLPQVPNGATGEIVRVQNQNGDGKAYSITPGNVKKDIAFFAPLKYGTGTGLKGEYFNNSALSGTAAFVRVDAPIAFQEWSFKPEPAGVFWIDYRITSNNHSMRWTGQVQAQYSEAYTFFLSAAGSAKLWINGALVMNNTSQSGPINMIADQRYDIKIEYTNTDNSSGMNLYWQSKSQLQQYIPQSQLYADMVVVQPPGTNQVPVANAGADATITLPTNYAGLNGTASSDPDGTIVSYKWTAVTAPSWYNIQYPDSANTGVYNMNAGTYVFRLQVTDDKGATATDEITIIVNPASDPTDTQELNITASPNPTTTSFRVTVTTKSSLPITVNILDSAGNVKNKYTNLQNNSSGLVGQSYAKGTYYAVAEQGTQKKTITLIKM